MELAPARKAYFIAAPNVELGLDSAWQGTRQLVSIPRTSGIRGTVDVSFLY